MFKKLAGYFGDYANLRINHTDYETSLCSAGVESGPPLYDKCMEIIDTQFPGKQNVSVLDLACGGGAFGKACKLKGKKYEVDGIDLFVPEKDLLIQSGAYRHIEERDILKAVVEKSYDIIVSNQFFEHVDLKAVVGLLSRLALKYQNILISVPLPYHTFAYTRDYLFSSLRQSVDMPDNTLAKALPAIHKCYFTKKLMKQFGFRVVRPPVYNSNFFLKTQTLEAVPHIHLEEYYRVITEEEISEQLEVFYRKFHSVLPRPKNLALNERTLARAFLLEPKSFKYLRLAMYLVTQPLRVLKRFLTKS